MERCSDGAMERWSDAAMERWSDGAMERSGVEWSGVEWSGVEWSGVECMYIHIPVTKPSTDHSNKTVHPALRVTPQRRSSDHDVR